jgi:hypothetical protein
MYLSLLANCEPSGYTMVGIFLRPAETYKIKKGLIHRKTAYLEADRRFEYNLAEHICWPMTEATSSNETLDETMFHPSTNKHQHHESQL